MAPPQALFDTVQTGYLPGLWKHPGEVDGRAVVKMLSFTAPETARAAGVPRKSVNLQRPHKELEERFRQWAMLIEQVAKFFEGDEDKTMLWFRTENPMLGGLKPREMIQFGRADKLKRIIADAVAGELP
ncbi:MAG: DUF2384 domain-containing protein [Candidatus Lambdaproteobacteria bacterium]|nr:DUF2384 domain-containing protein [Candidatus Lambdaproteobacteria bacterium]